MTLIERIEAASRADRELDRDIKELVGHSWDYGADWGTRGNEKPVAYPYTASIDAALTLVPDNCAWSIVFEREKRSYFVEIRMGYWTSFDNVFLAFAATPALALCAAALRAMEASKKPLD